MKPQRRGPLAGLRVIDLTSVVLGPYCTQMLGDMGAEVIKVESPEGDIARHAGPGRDAGMSGLFMNLNRNKRSIVVDLKSTQGREAVLRLAETADVFVHTVRPGAIARLGLAYADVAKSNPRIVYCNAYGFGRAGPYAEKPAYDDVIQAASGLAMLSAEVDGTPRYVPSVVADKVTGLMAANAISMALVHRERHGEGQEIEVAMFETMASFVLAEHIAGGLFDPPAGRPVYARTVSANRKPYRTRDGFIGVLVYNDRHWVSFFKLIGREDLIADPRFASPSARVRNVDAAYRLVEEQMLTRTTVEWLAALEAADIPVTRVMKTDELFDDPHLVATGFFQERAHPGGGSLRYPGIPMTFSKTPGAIGDAAPRLGEHTREILAEAGYAAAHIEALVTSKAVVAAAGAPA
jgi:crotonobetainyl-CoA:carnitine CoA-transferase CaiB-like acyl-CoA transferase